MIAAPSAVPDLYPYLAAFNLNRVEPAYGGRRMLAIQEVVDSGRDRTITFDARSGPGTHNHVLDFTGSSLDVVWN
jgi:hypothetical protein